MVRSRSLQFGSAVFPVLKLKLSGRRRIRFRMRRRPEDPFSQFFTSEITSNLLKDNRFQLSPAAVSTRVFHDISAPYHLNTGDREREKSGCHRGHRTELDINRDDRTGCRIYIIKRLHFAYSRRCKKINAGSRPPDPAKCPLSSRFLTLCGYMTRRAQDIFHGHCSKFRHFVAGFGTRHIFAL